MIVYPIDNLILPGIEPHETSKALAKEFLKLYKEGEIIGSERDYRAGIAFYTDKIPVNIENYSALRDLMDSGKRVWCVLKEKNIADLNYLGTEHPKSVSILYKSGKKRLLTNIPVDKK
jgi:hypothetical protein